MSESPDNKPEIDLSHTALVSARVSNIVNPQVSELPAKVNELDAKSRIGYHLARLVLAIICVFLVFMILYILLGKANGPSKIEIPSQGTLSDTAFDKKMSYVKILQDENKASRDFVLQITQMVLLNLLLPILTAILGYIFGSHREGSDA